MTDWMPRSRDYRAVGCTRPGATPKTDRRYAAKASVPPDRSRAEIERMLERHGATGFAHAYQNNLAMIELIATTAAAALSSSYRPATTSTTGAPPPVGGAARPRGGVVAARFTATLAALALVVEAKLEAVTTGIVSFEDEGAMHVVLPEGPHCGRARRPSGRAGVRDGAGADVDAAVRQRPRVGGLTMSDEAPYAKRVVVTVDFADGSTQSATIVPDDDDPRMRIVWHIRHDQQSPQIVPLGPPTFVFEVTPTTNGTVTYVPVEGWL